jgi:hypothetical protein
MTTNLALAAGIAAEPRPNRRRQQPDLVEVTATRAQRRARPRVLAAFVAVASLGILLLAQLGISMVLSKGAYQLDALQTTQTELGRSQQQLDENLSVLRSPQNLARNAQALGMIANSTPVYLDPKTGVVHGTPTPAAATDPAAATTSILVPNALLSGTSVVTKHGDTATSAEQPSAPAAAPSAPAAPVAGNSGAASASGRGTAGSSVSSDAAELQAPQTR